MTPADFAVQIKLITMYTIGLIALVILFLYLHHLTHRWFTKYSAGLLMVIIIMAIILTIVSKLS